MVETYNLQTVSMGLTFDRSYRHKGRNSNVQPRDLKLWHRALATVLS